MNIHVENEILSAYLDHELSAAEADAVQGHASACPSCRAQLESLRQAKLFLARAPRRAMPPELMAEIAKRLSQPAWREALGRLWPRPRVCIPAGAFAAAVLALAWIGLRSETPDQSIPLEPLLAAHCRYTAEALVPASELVASNYSAQLNAYYGDTYDQE